LGAVFDIPAELVLVLMLALGQPMPDAARPMPETQATQAVTSTRARPDNPYGFSTRGWLAAVRAQAADRRFARYARRIFSTTSGETYVPVAAERREILALRADAVIARHVAEQFAVANARTLAKALGRPASLDELYVAHVAGPRLAAELRQRAGARPAGIAAVELPELAEAAPELLAGSNQGATLAEIAAGIERRVARAERQVASPGAAPTRVLGWHSGIAK
jgi:hypothetical protein